MTLNLTLYFPEPATEEITLPGQPDSLSVQPSPSERMLPPNFVVPIQSVQAVDGQELRLPCKVTGKPMPQISWYHNGKNIDQDEEFVVTYNPDTGDISLLIVEVFPEDEGEYVCVAHNPAGDAVTRANLVVSERMETPVATDVAVDETAVKKVPEVETVPEAMEVEEDQVKPDAIERPKPVPMQETPRPESPSAEDFTPAVTQVPEEAKELPPEVLEEAIQPLKKPKAEAPTEPREVSEEAVQPDHIDRPKLEPMEQTRPKSPSPEEVMEVQKPAEQPKPAEEEAPPVQEAVLEHEVKPTKIDRPVPKSIVEEAPRPESPVYEEIGEAPIYEEIPERPPKVVEEEVLEPTVKADKIDRPKPKSIVEEKKPVEEEVPEEVIQPVAEKQEEMGPEIEEESVVPDKIAKKIEIPELKPEDETMDKKKSRDGEEAPRGKEEIHVEDIYATIDETAPVEEVSPEFIELLPPQAIKDGDKVVMKCKVIGNPAPSVTWFKDGEELSPSADFQMTYEPATGICTLEIPEVFPEDAGEYGCRAVNPFGDSVTTANLLVEGNSFILLPRLEIFSSKII